MYQNAIERNHKNEIRPNKSKNVRGQNNIYFWIQLVDCHLNIYFDSLSLPPSLAHSLHLSLSFCLSCPCDIRWCMLVFIYTKKAPLFAFGFVSDIFLFTSTEHETFSGVIFDNNDDNSTDTLYYSGRICWKLSMANVVGPRAALFYF